ncbi:hypothetical protein [Pseudofulvibacter geojedonensis]|uniref:DinB family protein n=1 Tax=Pseudofulvibacter geojedonensis TaxID=1123758 RepID=A0ABW3I2R4_9FLAO
MHKLAYNYIFQNAFDTFKVFETITYKSFGVVIEGHSKSIWQILNHIIIWQSFQINQITNNI